MVKQLSLGLEGDENYDLDNDNDNDNDENWTTEERLLNLLKELKESQLPMPPRLWRLKDVATYFRTTEATARRAMSMPNAPQPIDLPTQKEATLPPRWLAEEIQAYATRKARRKRTVFK